MDGNKDGVVTLSEFMEACNNDPEITEGITALDTAFWHAARPRLYSPWTWAAMTISSLLRYYLPESSLKHHHHDQQQQQQQHIPAIESRRN